MTFSLCLLHVYKKYVIVNDFLRISESLSAASIPVITVLRIAIVNSCMYYIKFPYEHTYKRDWDKHKTTY